jgi:formylglycine-generating enzyme required for sulfatase activity
MLLWIACCGVLSGCAAPPAPAPAADDPPAVTVSPVPAVTRVRAADDALMIHVPAGTFRMGSTEAEIAQAEDACLECPTGWFDGEHPEHEVSLDAYWIDKYEVTNRQYARFIADQGYARRELWTAAGWDWKEREGRSQPRYWEEEAWNRDDLPVVGVAWFEAVAYCRWAGARLPTEAEWERAAGWDASRRRKLEYPWGEAWDPQRANTAEGAVGHTTSPGAYCPTGASPVGACDMAGNAWEWCSSLYWPYPYRAGDGREDLEAEGTRSLRGGSWINGRDRARTRYRLPPFPGDFIMFDPTNGFRCATSGQEPVDA